MPFTVVQLTDPHIGAPWNNDPAGALETAVAAVDQILSAPPNAVIVSGDVANTPAEREYQRARTILDRLGAPVYVVPGNHDDRDALRRHFEPPGTLEARLAYAVDLGPMRLIALDTKRAGSDAGELGDAQLVWLDRVLSQDRSTPTLIAMHHPPLRTGMPAMDAIGIPSHEIDALSEIVATHRQVQAIASGHVHRAIVGELGGAPVVALPSTALQLALDFEATEIRLVSEPPCFAVHVVIDGRLIAHIQPIHSSPL